jgi:hypothetical protein
VKINVFLIQLGMCTVCELIFRLGVHGQDRASASPAAGKVKSVSGRLLTPHPARMHHDCPLLPAHMHGGLSAQAGTL